MCNVLIPSASANLFVLVTHVLSLSLFRLAHSMLQSVHTYSIQQQSVVIARIQQLSVSTNSKFQRNFSAVSVSFQFSLCLWLCFCFYLNTYRPIGPNANIINAQDWRSGSTLYNTRKAISSLLHSVRTSLSFRCHRHTRASVPPLHFFQGLPIKTELSTVLSVQGTTPQSELSVSYLATIFTLVQ